jgi:hypothetical protein
MKFITYIFCFFSLLALTANAHSWIACADYPPHLPLTSYDESQCRGFARGYDRFQSREFGGDAGFNYHVKDLKQAACKTEFSSDQYQHTKFKSPQYRSGQKIRLLWPSKNHAKAICTNPYIPDTGLRLFQHCGLPKENTMSLESLLKTGTLLWDFHRQGTKKGFQQCIDFCSNMDKAICYGDVTLPPTFKQGCPLIWVWEFNKGEFYTSCIDQTDGQVPIQSTTGKPVHTTTASPTNSPVVTTASPVSSEVWTCQCSHK